MQTTKMVGKIVLGLAQVLSKQPDVLRSKELIEQFKDHPWMQVFSFNFGWIVPICQVDYTQTFVLNTLVLPACLVSLVAATWATNRAAKDNGDEDEDDAETERERTMMWRSDMYFALFLSCKLHTFLVVVGCSTLSSLHLTAHAVCTCRPDDDPVVLSALQLQTAQS
jgi:hypothetical protein